MPPELQTDDAAERRRTRPRTGDLKAASAYSGLSEASLYVEAGRTPDLFLKWQTKTLVDFDVLDRVIDALPRAKIKPQGPRRPRGRPQKHKR
jgi:hypothetical protein